MILGQAPQTPSSLWGFAHKISKNRLQGDCEPTVRFTVQTAFEPLVRGCRIIMVVVTFFAKKSHNNLQAQ
jgi:hypothetical protein